MKFFTFYYLKQNENILFRYRDIRKIVEPVNKKTGKFVNKITQKILNVKTSGFLRSILIYLRKNCIGFGNDLLGGGREKRENIFYTKSALKFCS